MQIRVGYEIVYNLPQPTPMILALKIHPTRASDLVRPDTMRTYPSVPITPYRDGFGNSCIRIVAPQGRILITADAVVNDTGVPDAVSPWAGAARRDVDLLARQSILRDRPPFRNGMEPFRPIARRLGPRAGHLRLRSSASHFRLSICEAHQDGMGSLWRTKGCVPGLRAPRDYLLPLHEHPGPLLRGLLG